MSDQKINKHIYDNIFNFDFIEDETLKKDYVREFQVWVSFLDKIMLNVDGISVYVKGGTPLGIDVLKRSIDHGFGSLELDLIRDWDFLAIIETKQKFQECIKNYDAMKPFFQKKVTPRLKTDESSSIQSESNVEAFRKKNKEINLSDNEIAPCLKLHEIMRIAKHHRINKEGTKMIIIRRKDCVKICDDAFFEMVIKTEDSLSEIELPLTTMKIQLTRKNYRYLIFLSRLILMHNKYNINLNKHIDMVKFILNKIKIIIQPHDNDGFLKTNELTYDASSLSPTIQNILEKKLSDYNDRQFIASQFIHPDSIFYRLFNKNIPKSEKIRIYFKTNQIKEPSYLININRAKRVIKIFIDALSIEMHKIYQKYELDVSEATIKFYYDIKNDFTSGLINIVTDDDFEQFINKYDDKFKNTLYEFLNKMGHKRLINRNQKITEVMEYLYLESIKKMQDNITAMIEEYDELFTGVNVGRFNAQFNEIIKSDSSRILLSRIAVNFSANVADRVKVTKNVRTNELLYKLSQLEYDPKEYDKLFVPI